MPLVRNASQSKHCQEIIASCVPAMPTDVVGVIAKYLPPEGRLFQLPEPRSFREMRSSDKMSECYFCGQVAYLDTVDFRLLSSLGRDTRFLMCFRCSRSSLEDRLEGGLMCMPRKRTSYGKVIHAVFFKMITTTLEKSGLKPTRSLKTLSGVDLILSIRIKYVDDGKQFRLSGSDGRFDGAIGVNPDFHLDRTQNLKKEFYEMYAMIPEFVPYGGKG